MLATGEGLPDPAVRLWDPGTGEELIALRGHTGFIRSIDFGPDGQTLASGGGLWMQSHAEAPMYSVDNNVRMWNAFTGEETAVLRGHTELVRCVRFSPDGAILASGADDGTVRIWSVSTGKLIAQLGAFEGPVNAVAFDREGDRFITANSLARSPQLFSCLRIWDTSTWDERDGGPMLRYPVGSIALSPDGRLLALARVSRGGAVHVFDTGTWDELATLAGHTTLVSCLAFSSDGARLFTGSYDRSLRIWDTATFREMAVLRGHTGEIRAVACSPEGRRLVSSAADGSVRIWDSLEYRLRHIELERNRALRAEVHSPVLDLCGQESRPDDVLRRMLADNWPSEQHRQAACTDVLRELSKRKAAVRELLHGLYARLVFTDDVIAAIENDESLSTGLSGAAVMAAKAQGDSPDQLNERSWYLVRYAGEDAEAYATGLRGAQAAVAGKPDDAMLLNTLGVAQYRNGLYEDALATLRRSDSAQQKAIPGGLPHDVAVIAMSLWQLGKTEEAEAALRRAARLDGSRSMAG